ncbi:MAG: ribokinase, partial [Armatimonadetes bacterium]|nr:ribokinase [Armatimonadota bacterium]
RVVVVGSANTDLVCLLDRLPAPGETVLGGTFFEAPGGKGANQAVAAARLGAQVTFVARLGGDSYGDRALAGYQADGIDTRYIVRDPERPSGVALILVDSAGENSIAVASGANAALSPADIEAAEPAFAEANVVLMQLEIPLDTVAAAARLAKRQGRLVILNPAPSRELPEALLRDVDILTPNQTEAAQLFGALGEDDEAIAERLRTCPVPTVVLTRGRQGVLAVRPDWVQAIPAPEVSAVDTTAAGDAFNGALAACLSDGYGLCLAAERACAAGALAATRAGAQPSLPTLAELEAFLAR